LSKHSNIEQIDVSRAELPPLGLYIHIPWCVKKCPYCDFNSHQAEKTLPEKEYVAALAADLQAESPSAQGRKLSSIFIGGGTPSLFTDRAIGEILEHAERTLGFESDIEITLEANPGTFEQARFRGFSSAGVNRLSIGIQSFQDRQLQLLGRIHGRDEGLRAVEMARKAGFNNINIDLMHGLPEQNLERALADLEQALAFEPEHLSWYQLTIEQNTEFFSRPPTLPVEDTLIDIQDAGQARLSSAGFQQYEISAYSRPNKASQHNLNYWTFGDYIGIGAGAHGKLSLLEDKQYSVVRRRKTRLPRHYLNGINTVEDEAVELGKIKLEFLMNVLRLNKGVEASLFSARTGLNINAIAPQWQAMQAKGLMTEGQQRIQASPLGLRFLNTLLEGFLD